MLILFINAHKKNEQGNVRFKNFYDNVKAVLKSTIYYGNEVIETIRTFDDLSDYIYDEITFRMEERARRKFQSLEYIFIDGNYNFAPWSQLMIDVVLLIRKSIQNGKKIFCNGFAHFASYYYLSTKFDKHYTIGTARTHKTIKQMDYDYNEESGDLIYKGKKICNSGIKLVGSNRPFEDKSSQAVHNGVVLSTKFDYVVFDSKSGQRILRNIEVPFNFYWKSKLFCTSKVISKAKVDILFQTESGYPLAFSFKKLLSIQGLCSQFIKLLKNWLLQFTQRKVDEQILNQSKNYQTIAFENKIEFKKTLSTPSNFFKMSKSTTSYRPTSSKFSSIQFQKPAVRCSGKYETMDQRFLHEQNEKKQMNLGRTRMIFKGKLDEVEISNYVRREPSRPASSHKFREIHKQKWVGRTDFFNC